MKHFQKFKQDQENAFYSVEWEVGKNLNIHLFSGNQAFRGRATAAELEVMADKSNMDLESFYTTMQKTFDGTAENSSMEVQRLGETGMELRWKKVIANSDVTLLLGIVSLTQSSQSIECLFECLLEKNTALQSSLCTAEKAVAGHAQGNEQLLKRIQSMVVEKEDTEKAMYANFAALLNERSSKISSLQEALTSAQREQTEAKAENPSKVVRSRLGPQKKVVGRGRGGVSGRGRRKRKGEESDEDEPVLRSKVKRKSTGIVYSDDEEEDMENEVAEAVDADIASRNAAADNTAEDERLPSDEAGLVQPPAVSSSTIPPADGHSEPPAHQADEEVYLTPTVVVSQSSSSGEEGKDDDDDDFLSDLLPSKRLSSTQSISSKAPPPMRAPSRNKEGDDSLGLLDDLC